MINNLIIIENGEEIQCNTLEELVKILIDEKFYELSESERIEKMRIKAMANCLDNPKTITQDISNIEELEGKFVIKDEFTYILSLLILNKLIVLERKGADILTKTLNKDEIANNYIIVNHFAKDLLKKYVGTL